MVKFKTVLNRIQKEWQGRFASFRWPVEILAEQVAETKRELFTHRAAKTRYPIRAVRYWWTHCALLEESRRQQRQLIVADVGCSKGFLKHFVGNRFEAQWIGLDKIIDQDALGERGYTEAHECDLDGALPLPDHSVDVVVFLHVIEHLPRPSFTLQELSRILRPGGVLLAGSPIAPRWVARMRELQLQSRLRKGKVETGGHIKSMHCKRWRTLLESSNLQLEMLTGAFLARWSGSRLENHAWWLRLNQLWGAVFPSLGGELYLAARKRVAVPQSAPCLKDRILRPHLGRKGWGWACAALILLAVSLYLYPFDFEDTDLPVHQLIAQHQDGNDQFYAISHPAMDRAVKLREITELRNTHEIFSSATISRTQGKDPHFLVSWDSLAFFSPIASDLGLTLVDSRIIRGVRFALFSGEGESM